MAIIHLMVLDFIILGRFATPSQQGICALTGLSQVVNLLTILCQVLNLFLLQAMITSFKGASTIYSTQITDFVHKLLTFLPTKAPKSRSTRTWHIIRLSHSLLHEC